MTNDAQVLVVGHLSDTHLGYEAYRALSANGNNVRGEDIVRAFVASCRQIIAEDPPLVIHAGDIIDKPQVPIRYMVVIRKMLTELAGRRPDGTRRQVVVISGNHDQPRSLKEANFLELFKGIPGLHIVTNRYQHIEFSGEIGDTSEGADPILKDVVVHALPHDVLKTVDFMDVQPVAGKRNILTSHCVAGGSELYVKSLGREFALPTDVLSRDWEYVALGHWHKQGPVPLVSTGGKTDSDVGRVWYAGSTENMSFRDLRDNGEKRGWLHVILRKGQLPQVTRKNVPIRTMFRLPHLDVTGKTPEEITNLLKTNVREGNVAGAVVGQIVEGLTRETWALVDVASVRDLAKDAVNYEVTVKYSSAKKDAGDPQQQQGMGDLGNILAERAKILLSPSEVEPAIELSSKLLGDSLNESSPTPANTDEGTIAQAHEIDKAAQEA